MPVFTHQGLQLHYLDEGQGPAVLLLHAFPLSSEMYKQQIAALSDRYRVIAPDLRGFGKSEVGDGPTEMATFAQDALALLDHLQIPSAVVGGVSMGGYTSLALLDQDPSRVRALVLADTQMGADDEAGRQRREETARQIEQRGMSVLVESLLPKLIAQPPAKDVERKLRSIIEGNHPKGAAAASRGMGLRPDSRNILARFAGPTLIIVGENDAITPREKANQMAEVISHASVVELPNAGHISNLDSPDAFNRTLDAFLETVP